MYEQYSRYGACLWAWQRVNEVRVKLVALFSHGLCIHFLIHFKAQKRINGNDERDPTLFGFKIRLEQSMPFTQKPAKNIKIMCFLSLSLSRSSHFLRIKSAHFICIPRIFTVFMQEKPRCCFVVAVYCGCRFYGRSFYPPFHSIAHAKHPNSSKIFHLTQHDSWLHTKNSHCNFISKIQKWFNEITQSIT